MEHGLELKVDKMLSVLTIPKLLFFLSIFYTFAKYFYAFFIDVVAWRLRKRETHKCPRALSFLVASLEILRMRAPDQNVE